MKSLSIALPKVEFVHPSYSADQPDLQTLLSTLYEPLLRWHNGRLAGAAVEAWSTPDGGHTWDLKLRDGLTFSDGTPCDALDVLECVHALSDADGPFGMGGVYADYLSEIDVQVTARDTLSLQSQTPTADYLDLLTAFYVYKPSLHGGAPIGTTAYRLEEHHPDEELTVSAVRPVPNRPETIRFVAVASAEERLEMVGAGVHDVCVGVEGLPQSVLGASGVDVHGVPNTLSVTMFLNGYGGLFADPRARLAINHAIDVDELIEEVWHGHAIPASSVVSPFHYGFAQNQKRIAFDPDAARRLFDMCDMPTRLRFRAPLVTPDRSPKIGEQISHQLARIGVDAEFELETDRPKYAKEVSEKKIEHGAIFDSSPLSTSRILIEKVSSEVQGLWWQGVRDEHVDSLIASARAEYQETRRWEAYQTCLSELATRPPWLYLFHPIRMIGKRDASLPVTLEHSGVPAFTS